MIREVLHTPTAAVRCEKHTPAFFATGSFKSMSWPRAAQPTELAAWRRRRQQDGAIRAFRRGRLSDSEFRAAAANVHLPADAMEDEVLQRRELAAIVGWSLALKSKPSNTGLKWAGEAADADRRGAQHPRCCARC